MEALRGILNTGYRKGGKYSRCVGQGTKMEVRDFSSFCPKAIAGIGKLPDTIADRSIPIRLKRAARNENVTRFRRREILPEADQIHAGLQSWCAAIDALEYARPELPIELSDRKQDVAEPLLALADAAGGVWPTAARLALTELCAEARTLEDSNGIRLLSDIRDIFNERQTDRLSSEDLATALSAIETSPWAEWSNGKPITKPKLARLLGRFGITPRTIRLLDGRTPKGYHKDDFADDWVRYLPSDAPPSPDPPTSNRHTATTSINTRENANFESATPPLCGGSENAQNPNKNGPCGGVAVSKPPLEGAGYVLNDGSGIGGYICVDCHVHYATLPGWKAHKGQGRCVRAEAAD